MRRNAVAVKVIILTMHGNAAGGQSFSWHMRRNAAIVRVIGIMAHARVGAAVRVRVLMEVEEAQVKCSKGEDSKVQVHQHGFRIDSL